MLLKRTYQLFSLSVLILVVYYSVIFAPLCFVDDTKLVFFDAPDSRLADLLRIIFSGGGYYRPLLFATFVFDNYVWLLFESFLHLENVLLHLGNVLLLYGVTERFATRLKLPPNSGVPFWSALLFGLHPLVTESVNWISGRTDPLACLFLLLALRLLLDWLDTQKLSRLLLLQVCFLLACLAKETAVFFIGPVCVLLAVWPQTDSESADRAANYQTLYSRLRTAGGMLVASWGTVAGYFVLRKYASYTSSYTDKSMAKATTYFTQKTADSAWFDKLLEFFRTIGFYSKKLLLPWPLNFNIVKVSDWYILLGLLVLAGLLWYCWQQRNLLSGLLLSAALLASSALIVSIGKLAWTPYAERYLYIPLIFFIPFCCCMLYRQLGELRAGLYFRVVMLVCAGAFLVTTFSRNLVWMDRYALYEDNYKKAPDFHTAIKFYSHVLRMQGLDQQAKELAKRLPPKPVKKKPVAAVRSESAPKEKP